MALIIQGSAELPLLLREKLRDGSCISWVQEWYCQVPADGASYMVTRDEWSQEDGLAVRRVYEVRYVPLKVVMHDG